MIDLDANARGEDAGEASPRGAFSRFVLILSVMIFALASLLPDSWSPLAMSAEADAIAEPVFTDASADGDPLTPGRWAVLSLMPERCFRSRKSNHSRSDIAPPAARNANCFEARGPPGA